MKAPIEFRLTTKIICNPGSASAIGTVSKSLNMSKVLLVTDRGVSGSGVLDSVLPFLENDGIQHVIFEDIDPNPTIQSVDNAVEIFKKENCDGVIAIGGGSPIDAGKCIGALVNNPGSAFEYLGVDLLKNDAVPCICVPTTAGTGAEITDVAMLSDLEKKLKMGIRANQIAPAVALLDPELTLSLPAGPTRDSGLDALTHAIESYISVNSWQATDALTIKAIELIGDNLRSAVHYGKDSKSRENMLYASLIAGMGFHNTKLCLVHAITAPLGGMYNVPHGGSNAIVLPHAMKFLLPGALEKFAQIAIALGENIEGLSLREAAEKAVSAVEKLSEDVGLPDGLSVYGVEESSLPELAKTIAGNFMVPLSPRVADKEDILKILKESL